MPKRTIHISEKEATSTNVGTLLAHVRAGAEVIIENDARPVAVLHPAEPVRRTIPECIVFLKTRVPRSTQNSQAMSRLRSRAIASDELLIALPIYLVTVTLALRAGQIDGENQARGIRIPLADLLIGLTALELGYSVGTANLRHFQQVPSLTVVRL